MEILLTEHELISALLWIEFLLIPFVVCWYLKRVKRGPQGEMGYPGPVGMMGSSITEEEIKSIVKQILAESKNKGND